MRAALAGALALFLVGCAVTPHRLSNAERERIAAETRKGLFEGQEPIAGQLTLAEATARAIKYQAEYRQRQMEEAAAAAQLDVARFDLLPKITLNAYGWNWRNNDAFGFGFTPGGTVALNPSASVERVHHTNSIGLSWSMLDFGVSYFHARQVADQQLVTEERRRKAVQTLIHDVRIAWWRAEAAQRLLPAADRLLAEIDQAIEKTRHIEARRLLPPVQTATLRRALLDLSQQIALRRQELAQARVELAALVNAPNAAELQVASPESEQREVRRLTAEIDQLEELALRSRPEMAEEGYRSRITADEARKALVALLPGVNLDLARIHDSNQYLVNNTWNMAGLNVALNLVKAFSLPALNRSAAAQRAADDARRQAMAMAILAQTRIAAVRYTLVADEFRVWDEAANDDDRIVDYLGSSGKAGIDTELEIIRARARAMASHMNRDLSYANLQASVANVFSSVGYDVVPRAEEQKSVSELAALFEAAFGALERASFTSAAMPPRAVLSAGRVSGASSGVAALLQEGVGRVLDSAQVQAPSPAEADIRLDLSLALDAPREGRRSATVTVSAVPRAGEGALTREFRTTLSQPIDDEQWRVLGEGAAYLVMAEIGQRARLRAAPRTPVSAAPQVSAVLDGTSLVLRLDLSLGDAREETLAPGALR